jgi:hypothetical protein
MSLTGDVLNLEMPFLVKVSRLGWRMGCVEHYFFETSPRPRALDARSVDILLDDDTLLDYKNNTMTLSNYKDIIL